MLFTFTFTINKMIYEINVSVDSNIEFLNTIPSLNAYKNVSTQNQTNSHPFLVPDKICSILYSNEMIFSTYLLLIHKGKRK